MKDKLKKLKQKLNELNNEISEKQNQLYEISKDPLVDHYNYILMQLQAYHNEKQKTLLEYTILNQNLCEHPLWYLLKEEIDGYEMRVYWKCKCVQCEKVVEQRSNEFQNVVYNSNFFNKTNKALTYNDIKKIYNNMIKVINNGKLEKNLITEHDVAKILVKNYSQK